MTVRQTIYTFFDQIGIAQSDVYASGTTGDLSSAPVRLDQYTDAIRGSHIVRCQSGLMIWYFAVENEKVVGVQPQMVDGVLDKLESRKNIEEEFLSVLRESGDDTSVRSFHRIIQYVDANYQRR